MTTFLGVTVVVGCAVLDGSVTVLLKVAEMRFGTVVVMLTIGVSVEERVTVGVKVEVTGSPTVNEKSRS